MRSTADELERPRRAIFFGSDGMRHDLMKRYAAAGEMPVLRGLMERGATGEGGCLPALPTNTGSGWATLATGAWSGTTGAINNVFHATDTPIGTATSGFNSLLVQAETLIQAAERQGLSTASLEWPGTMPARSAGPVVDFRTFYSTRGALLKHDPPAHQPDIARRLGVSDQRTELAAAIGWQNVPVSRLTAREATVAIRSTRPQENTDRVYNVYVYATSNAGYDRALIAEGKDGGAPLCELAAGQWAEVRVVLEGGRQAGLHFKLIELALDLSQFWLYFTSISRARAHPPDLEDLLASPEFPVPETADHGPIEAGLIDAATYVEQGLMFYDRAERVFRHVVETYRPDVLLAGSPVTDEFSHQFMALVTPAYPGYNAAIAPLYAGYLRQAYAGVDRLLGVLIDLFPEDTIVAVSSDHGFGAAWRSVNANLVLAQAGLLTFDVEGKPAPDSKAVAYWAGGTCNIYINLAGREPGGLVPAHDYEPVRQTIVDSFEALNSGAAEGGKVIERIYRLEETRAIQTSCGSATMYFPGRTGDVVVFAAPPYQFDAPDPLLVMSDSPLLGQHGYLPDTIDETLNVNMRSPFVIAGRGVRAGARIAGVRAIDIAPTIAALLDIDPPAQADGRAVLTPRET